MSKNLETAPIGVIHEEESNAVVAVDVARGYELPVAAVIGKADRFGSEDFHESGLPAAMLKVGPAVLDDACHVEAVALGDEADLGGSKNRVVGPLRFKPRVRRAGTVADLAILDPCRKGDLGELPSHDEPLAKLVSYRLCGKGRDYLFVSKDCCISRDNHEPVRSACGLHGGR